MSAPDRARAFLGVPWVHQGRNPDVGLDCVGLLVVTLPEYAAKARADYGRDPSGDEIEQSLTAALGAPVVVSPARALAPLDRMRPGDVVAIRYAGPIRHVGIVGQGPGYLTLIHTDSHLGRVTEHRIDSKWARRIALVYRPETPHVW